MSFDVINTAESTRAATLKWVIVVDSSTPTGRLANAVACVAASTGEAVSGLIGPSGPDASGFEHPGLPWAGCSVLTADAATLAEVRAKACASENVHVTDMPLIAQTTRVYDEYLTQLASTKPEDLAVSAVSIIGPRNRVSKLVKRLELA
ncbi:DUF2000 domain-containing protein [Amycolatopsis sp. cg5]|uniref:DUF2000 domain-containing protein n=1 Tax=Amycolatopsis sp. cg5 TaxID=3238802 RepID=UPI0035261B13